MPELEGSIKFGISILFQLSKNTAETEYNFALFLEEEKFYELIDTLKKAWMPSSVERNKIFMSNIGELMQLSDNLKIFAKKHGNPIIDNNKLRSNLVLGNIIRSDSAGLYLLDNSPIIMYNMIFQVMAGIMSQWTLFEFKEFAKT
jgi:hypothetical protein